MGIYRDIIDFLCPRFCVSCGERLTVNENSVCTVCLGKLPRTNYYLQPHNEMERDFWTECPIERATAFFFYDGKQRHDMIYAFKYRHHPYVARDLARAYADEIKVRSAFFEGIDAIVPVPLHWRRLLHRQYNQSEYLAQGISSSTGIPILNNVLKRAKHNPSQTHLSAMGRELNVEGIFVLSDADKVRGKHILIVDDVCTTGATILSCAKELVKAGDVRISVLTLAKAASSGVPVSDKEFEAVNVKGLPLLE